MEQRLWFYLMLMTVSISILLKLLEMVCICSRKDTPYELLGIFKLVNANKNISDEEPFHFSRSG